MGLDYVLFEDLFKGAFDDLHVSEFVKIGYLLWRLLAFLYSLLDHQLSRTFGADSGDDRLKKVEDVMHP